MRPKQKVKLKDIADSLGVSVVTVSNSLAHEDKRMCGKDGA